MAGGKRWQRDNLEILALGREELLLVCLHVTDEVDVWHLCVQSLVILILVKVQVGIGDHEGVTIFEWVHSKGVRSCGAEMPHLKSLLYRSHASRAIFLVQRLGVEHHVSHILAARPKESEVVHLELMGVRHQIDRLSLLGSDAWEQATVEGLLR